MKRLSALMTVYNESEFIEYAIRACLPYVDDLVIVEGAYQETVKCGAEPRSTDGTFDIVSNIRDLTSVANLFNLNHNTDKEKITDLYCKLHVLYANEETDKDQRNVGLEKIKKLNPDGWCLIIDGDEIYDKNTFSMVKVAAHTMEKQNKLAAYFKSLTFVNDFEHYTEQEFPRLFRITSECKFVNDNFMEWSDKGINWFSPYILKIPYIRYHHYAFCKNRSRFKLKKDWWETRFTGQKFEYDWYVNEEGNIWSPNHTVFKYTGKHPEIMEKHPLWKNSTTKGKN